MAGPLPVGKPWPAENLISTAEWWNPTSFHAYVHVPFCKVRCGYCDFNTYTSTELRGTKQEAFHESILAEIDFSQKVLDESGAMARPLTSVFFGGGTPTILIPEQFERMLHRLEEVFGLEPNAEVTVEANPDTVDLRYLAQLRAIGVNRISFGVQSFDPAVLQILDRSHDPRAVPRVVAEAKSVGLETSIDLIYGTPGETLDSWRHSVLSAIELDTNHISAYSLIVETGTKLASRIRRGELADISLDYQADCYELVDELLQGANFSWYEVSNWSRTQKTQSAHNLAYWQSRDWWGYGPGAHSHLAGNRWWNVKHPSAYQGKLSTSQSPAAGMERLSRQQDLEERLLLQLRTVSGVDRAVIRELGIPAERVAQEIADGLLQMVPDNRIAISARGRLFADAIVLRLLNAE